MGEEHEGGKVQEREGGGDENEEGAEQNEEEGAGILDGQVTARRVDGEGREGKRREMHCEQGLEVVFGRGRVGQVAGKKEQSESSGASKIKLSVAVV